MGHDAPKQMDREHLAAVADADARAAHSEPTRSPKVLAAALISLPVMTAVIVFPGVLPAIETALVAIWGFYVSLPGTLMNLISTLF